MWIIGHRGAAGTFPENTLVSVQSALDCGVDWIEIDIRMVDGAVIVLHDETLERTTNGSGSIYQHRLAELRKLDAGGGEKIPLLSEVMELIDGQAGLNIEFKQRGLVQAVVALTSAFIERQARWRNRIMFSSFIPEVMTELSGLDPSDCLIGALSESNSDNPIQFAKDLKAYSANISLKQLSKSLVDAAHELGLKVLVYTVNDSADIRRCNELSVDGIFTDFPERAIAFMRNSPIISRTRP